MEMFIGAPFRTRALLTGVLVLLCGSAIVSGSPSRAASPTSGTLPSPSGAPITWIGPEQTPADNFDNPYDDFNLEVVLPTQDHWDTHDGSVTVTIRWTDPTDDYNLHVYKLKPDGTLENRVAGASNKPPGATSETVTIDEPSGRYLVKTEYLAVVEPSNEDSDDVGYAGTATFKSNPALGARQVVFDDASALEFAPASVVSAHFLGAEPMMTMERTVQSTFEDRASLPGRIDSDRVFVDWPGSSRTQSSQLSRSTDGGDSFRLLFDPGCSERSRPNCNSAGGGDTVTDVNLVDGTLYFSDQEFIAGNEALASSTDHGDSFPLTRQHVITNPSGADRQWLAAAGNAVILDPSDLEVGAFLSYHVPVEGQYVQAIVRSDDAMDGRVLPQVAPQLTPVIQSGPLRVDTSDGPGRGWLYQPYVDLGLKVATAEGRRYASPAAWQPTEVWDDFPVPFPWLELDARGNAYLLWVDRNGVVFYSASAIDDPENNPHNGPVPGRPGTTWTAPQRVSHPNVGSAAFPEIVAGDPGRVAITYMGTSEEEHRGAPVDADATDNWHVYAAVITNALQQDGPARVTTGFVSHRPAHTSHICTTGFTCIGEADRSLLDMIDIGYDQNGRVAVVFADNNSGFGAQQSGPSTPTDKTRPFAHFAKQVSGPSLLDGRQISVDIPSGEALDAIGDATWPNQSSGALLPSLDARSLSIRAEGSEIVARLDLADAGFMARDVVAYNNARSKDGIDYPNAERLQYIVRVVTDRDIYHLSARSIRDGGPLTFFGGVLGPNDTLRNPDSTILGAAYKLDPGFQVNGALEGNTLEMRAPLATLALGSGGRIYSVTAFTTAGPQAENESLNNPMRTIDATPPFDDVLPAATQPSATATASPTVTPATTPSVTPSASATATPTTTPTKQSAASLMLSPIESTSRPGTLQSLVAIVTDAEGRPVEGATVEWDSRGVGELLDPEPATGPDGQARVTARSDARGDQSITATVAECAPECRANAVVHWGPARCDVFGTAGNDFLEGTAAGETICGFGGNDVIASRGGNDILIGGAGTDRLFGGAGTDRLVGGRGNDTLAGGRGSDTLRGKRGSDTLNGGLGRDRLVGGRGNDRLNGGPGRDRCSVGRRGTMKNCDARLRP